jgi:hypothetical protein
MFAAQLYPNPTTDVEIRINDLRLKYRTYMVEMDIDYVGCLFICLLLMQFKLLLIKSNFWLEQA